MRRREGRRVGRSNGEDPASAGPGRRRPRGWAVGLTAALSLAASVLATVAPAERDAYLRTHPQVPDLVGKTVAEAARMMVPLHFGILVNGSRLDPTAPEGVILVQNPPAGRFMPVGTVIQLKVSQGSGVVPRLRGVPVQDAARRLERVGLRLGRVEDIADDSTPGTVLEQFTPPGYRLEANAPVAVLVSHGPDSTASVPPPPLVPLATGGAPLPIPPAAVPSTGGMPGALYRPSGLPGPGGADTASTATTTIDRRQEGGPRAGSTSTNCAAHAQRQRDEVCPQPADDGGAQPDLYGPEHRDVPAGP